MVMDRSLGGLYGSVSDLKLNDETLSFMSDQTFNHALKLDDEFDNQNYVIIPRLPPDPIPSNSASSLNVSHEGDGNEDFDFSDVVLKYISEMLMEEDMEEKTCMFQESSVALQAAEKSLYDLIGEKYPPSNQDHIPHLNHHGSPEENHDLIYGKCSSSTSFSSGDDNSVDPGLSYDVSENRSAAQGSHSSHSSGSSTVTVTDSFADSPVSALRVSEMLYDSESVMQFKKGFEEASKFIPNGSLLVDAESNGLFLKDPKEGAKDVVIDVGEKRENVNSKDRSRGKKNPHPEDSNLGGRSNKQSAVYTESTVSPADFDMVLLNHGKDESALRLALQNRKIKDVRQDGPVKGSNGGKARGRKRGGKKNVVDLRTLLTLCAQAVVSDDRRGANDLLKQIRQNASPTGDGMQRMAIVFADGLEARMAGSGTEIYNALITKPTSAADVLKAYHLLLAACPFKKLSNCFSNKTIMNVAEKAEKLHIVDFGILYGFQWPCLIERLSTRQGGPPKLRITGIDLPHPGFRPQVRVEETGRRLANYARRFNVPFEFNAIAQKWDTIQLEDLKIDRGEVLVVNCLYRSTNLLDETVVVDCPRNIVLNLIRRMNPDVFIHGIVNGAFNAPFFITRFREALFHFSTMFDMLEVNVARDSPERLLIERKIFAREAMNVIACEGAERIERPETYKQWQVRTQRCGFMQLPLDREIVTTVKEKVKALYHKDFSIDEDGQWLLQGWKGRIVHCLSSWKPA